MPEKNNGHNGSFHARRHIGRRRLAICVAITAVAMVVEFVAGILTGSLALVSDAGHMLSHGFALFISYVAMLLAQRPATEKRTFGLYRAEILAALFNGGTLLVISGFIVWHAYRRLLHPVEIAAGWMLAVAVAGLAVNLLTALILMGSARDNLNIKSAFFHMIGDMFSSVCVVGGAIILLLTGWYPIDAILSVLVCIIILVWAYKLIRESVEILLEATPRDVDISTIEERLAGVEGVTLVHDVHVWTITSDLYYMSGHVLVHDMMLSKTAPLLEEIEDILQDEFNIAHATIQFECGEKGRHTVVH